MDIQKILRSYDVKPNKDMDQHFIIDEGLLNKIINYSNINKNEDILEIGSGLCNLTEKIAEVSNKVYALENDEELFEISKKEIDGDNVFFINENALNYSFPTFDKCVSNPPYSIMEPLLQKLSNYEFDFSVFVLPKSFVKRIISKKYEGISFKLISSLYDVEILEEVSKKSFKPLPKVKPCISSFKLRRDFDLNNQKDLYLTVKLFKTYNCKKAKNALLEALIDFYGEIYDKRLTKNEGKEIISRFNLAEGILEKRINQLNSNDFKQILDELVKFSF